MPTRWGTIVTVNYLRAAQGRDLVAVASVDRRGRSLRYCTVETRDADGPSRPGSSSTP